MGGTLTWASMQSQPVLSPNELFPSICKMADGTMLRVVPRMTHHLSGNGELYTLKGTDNGNGTITWGTSWQKIYPRKGEQWDVRGGQASLIPSGIYAGRVAIVLWDVEWLASRLYIDYLSPWPTVRVATYTRVLVSTDENCTDWTEISTLPPGAPSSAPETNDCNEAPIVFLPNGDWMTCNYTRETHDYIGWYSSSYFRSTDDGHTWELEGFVGPRANPAEPQDTTYLADEPQMLVLQNGEMLCMIRALEAGNPQQLYHHLYRCTNPTDRGAMVWTFEARTPATIKAGSRCALFQHSNGMVVHGFRTVFQPPGQYGLSAQGAFHYSNDDGHTWTAPRNLDSGALTTTSTGAVYSYGAWAELDDGSLVHVYCEDNYTSSYTKQALFSVESDPTAVGYGNNVSAGYGDAELYVQTALLTIDPASTAWEQLDTQIIVRVLADPPTATEAVVTSGYGGLVRFRGADAELFEISLDGSTWYSAVDVAAGSTDVWLRVSPVAAGTTLTAEIGIPL